MTNLERLELMVVERNKLRKLFEDLLRELKRVKNKKEKICIRSKRQNGI